VQSAKCVTAEGDRSSHQQGGECEGGELCTSVGGRRFMGMEAVACEDGGKGGGGRVEGREGVMLGGSR
jgi:hypothetical protein